MAVPAGFKSFPLPIAQLSLAAVLKCGQSFRWTAHPLNNIADPTTDKSDLAGAGNLESELIVPTHEYRIALKDRVVCLRQDEMALFYRSVFPVSDESARTSTAKPEVKDEPENANICVDKDEETLEWLKDYFQLEVDLIKLYSKWAERDVVFRDTVKDRFAGIRILRQDPWENVVSCVLR
jgi:N-glycosylase/DNA lyase